VEFLVRNRSEDSRQSVGTDSQPSRHNSDAAVLKHLHSSNTIITSGILTPEFN